MIQINKSPSYQDNRLPHKRLIFILSVLLLAASLVFVYATKPTRAYSASDFVVEINTQFGSGGDSFIIPTSGGGYNYNVDCDDDGVIDHANATGDVTCIYLSPGVYTVAISGDFPRLAFGASYDVGKITKLKQWGACNGTT